MEPLGLTSWMGLIGAGSMFGIFFGSLPGGITAIKSADGLSTLQPMLLTAIVSCCNSSSPDPPLIAISALLSWACSSARTYGGASHCSANGLRQKRAGILGWLLVF